MENEKQPVGAALRIAHLDKLAKGEEQIEKEKKESFLPLIIIGISVIVIISLIIYYENKLEEEKNKHSS